jgi:hypothetical protein
MMLLALLTVLSFDGSCVSVTGERITAKDLARAVPEFAGLPEGLSLGFAPLPGAHRGFTGADIQKMAAEYGLKTERRESVCFEWSMHRLDRADILKAMVEALGHSGVELQDFSLFPAPPGRIVFPLASLNRQLEGNSFWRGYVQYEPDKRFNIWAKVKLDATVPLTGRADVVGGSRVKVVVRSGGAELKMDAQAITSGCKGQTVTIRNPRSGRSFSAEVTGKDSVVVEAGTTLGETEK